MIDKIWNKATENMEEGTIHISDGEREILINLEKKCFLIKCKVKDLKNAKNN